MGENSILPILRTLEFQIVYKNTVKPVLSGDSKIDKTKVLKSYGSLINY